MHYVSQKLIYPELVSNAQFPKALDCIQLEIHTGWGEVWLVPGSLC